jgi:amphi-Trp domain-containing protein
MSKKELGLKQTMPLEQAASYLASFAESLRSGKVLIEQEDQSIEMNPGSEALVEVKAKQKKDRQKFSLTVTWSINDEKASADLQIAPGGEQEAKDAK